MAYLTLSGKLKYMLTFGGMYIILGRKYLGHPYELIRILGETSFPLSVGRIEYPIVFFVGRNIEFVKFILWHS